MLNRLSLNGFYSVDSSQIESLNKPTLSRRHYFATLLPNRLTQAFTKSGGPTEDDIPSSYSSYSSVFGRYQPPILKKNEGTKKRMKMLGSLGRKRQHPQRSGSDIDSVNSFSTYANASGATEDDLSSIVVSEMEDSIVSEVLKDHHAFESLFVRQPYFIGLRYRSEDHLSNQSQSQSFTSQGDASGAQHGVINVVRSYISALEAAEHDPVYSASATQARQRTRTERNRTLIRSSRPLGLGSSRQVRQQNLSVSSVPGNPITGTLPRHMHSIRDTSRRMRAITRVTGYLTDYLDPFTSNSEEDNRLGFANLPDQMHRKAVKKGFNFTLIVVGESGLGKSTLINSLFLQDLYKERDLRDCREQVSQTTKIEKRQLELDERGVKLRLTVVDTPGFCDAVNCSDCWKPIEDYIDGTFEQYFKDECGLNRKNIQDNRAHCCLYFISPYGHGLRQIDVEFMRRLHGKVNIVPIIAKADALTSQELVDFKRRVMADLDRHKINIYRLPECDSDEDEDIKQLDQEIKNVLPFAVIGSNCVIDLPGGKRTRGREYPWGVVEVENPTHCDFTKLRVFLLKTHMQDLKDMTLDVHYENYRAKYITERMSKRQNDRRGGSDGIARLEKDAGPGFAAIVDSEGLLKQRENEELKRAAPIQAINGSILAAPTAPNSPGGQPNLARAQQVA